MEVSVLDSFNVYSVFPPLTWNSNLFYVTVFGTFMLSFSHTCVNLYFSFTPFYKGSKRHPGVLASCMEVFNLLDSRVMVLQGQDSEKGHLQSR